jgi:hypothetical protein
MSRKATDLICDIRLAETFRISRTALSLPGLFIETPWFRAKKKFEIIKYTLERKHYDECVG